MLNGLYGYLFGEQTATVTTESTENRENEAPTASKERIEEDDWQFIHSEAGSGRSSPVLVPHLELQDIDSLSLQNEQNANASQKLLRRAEEMRQARAQVAQRVALETALFAEAAASLQVAGSNKAKLAVTTNPMTTSSLKRVSAAAQVDSKGKPRSKKASKTPSGRNNDRKCNNLN